MNRPLNRWVDPPTVVTNQYSYSLIVGVDPNTESRLPLLKGLDIYVPRDEKFGHLKMSDFLGYALKSLSQDFVVALESVFDKTPNDFDSFEDVIKLYEGGIKLPDGDLINKLTESIPFEFLKALLQTDGAPLLKLPMPDVIKGMQHDAFYDEIV